MRSVFTKLLLWCFGTLVLALIAFFVISATISVRSARRQGFFGRINSFHLEQAVEAYDAGGREALRVYLAKMEKHLPGQHYLTDGKGIDLLTGADHSDLLQKSIEEGTGPPLLSMGGARILVDRSQDDRYRFIVVAPPPIGLPNLFPYFLLILFVVGFLMWLLAVNITSPLRQLTQTVERFGRGDLGARAKLTRRDEIGNLARVFDEMADRIQNLLTAERRLLQDISHELRSPLARLSFAAELTKTADNRDAAVARMKKEIERLADLVRALLEVTRAEGDPSAVSQEPVSLKELLRAIVEDCRMEADARQCELLLEGTNSPVVLGDHELLRRAIENVVRNAIRYAPQESTVEVKLSQSSSSATIAVRDYGQGVPEELLPKIFTPFFRVDSSRDSATGGVGLGLAIAQRAVSLHHGSISARNGHPGLLVTIELPLTA